MADEHDEGPERLTYAAAGAPSAPFEATPPPRRRRTLSLRTSRETCCPQIRTHVAREHVAHVLKDSIAEGRVRRLQERGWWGRA